MPTIQSNVSEIVIETSSQSAPDTIRCYLDVEVGRWTAHRVVAGERLLASQALQLLMRLDQQLKEARADWNQDRFRRVMRARAKAVLRVNRRWNSLDPAPAIALGKLRRRYHANLARYLYQAQDIAVTDLGK
jgi:hypothetical protein